MKDEVKVLVGLSSVFVNNVDAINWQLVTYMECCHYLLLNINRKRHLYILNVMCVFTLFFTSVITLLYICYKSSSDGIWHYTLKFIVKLFVIVFANSKFIVMLF